MTSAVASILSWSRRHRTAVVAATLVLHARLARRRPPAVVRHRRPQPASARRRGRFRRSGRFSRASAASTSSTSSSPRPPASRSPTTTTRWMRGSTPCESRRRSRVWTAERSIPSRDFSWLADRQLLLFRDDAPSRGRFNGSGPMACGRPIAARRELLTVPSPEVAQLVRQDPLGPVRPDARAARAGAGRARTSGSPRAAT